MTKWKILGLGMFLLTSAAQAAPFELKHGDHICLIGNTLAERMQHTGWLEALLYSRFPGHKLVIRNLGFSGDELTLRLRSAGFGSPDDHLTFNRADVVFAFFGYNESFGDEAGLETFKKDLQQFIDNTRGRRYNGTSSPRLVLFSPIGHENLHSPNLPNGVENNRRLKSYTAAMAETARINRVQFVDLFTPSLGLYGRSKRPLTINGIHLNDEGDRQIAHVVDRSLFGPEPAGRSPALLEKLRAAIVDKNLHWYNRYRTVDGYSIYGGRADLRFVDGQTNREVMQRELEILDAMTANRDRRIWSVAQGQDVPAQDDNTPPFIPVKTNKPGQGPNGEHLFLKGEEAIGMMKVGQSLRINLFASEETFPLLAKPVQMAFDTRGRLWVAVWPSYPHWKPKDELNDKLLILEDTDNDGKADRCTVFADGLHCPTGFDFYNGGVIVANAPDLIFLKDTDGDGKADVRERVLHGLDSADTHHAANSFAIDPGGAIYFQEGTFHHTQVETPYGPPQRCANAGVFRYEPRTHKFEVYVTYPFANPHGHVFDRWGMDIVTDGTGSQNYYAAAFSGRLDYPRKHPGLKTIFPQRTRPCPGTEILNSRHFPPEFQGNFLIGNVIGFHGILRYKLEDQGAGYEGKELEPIVQSADPNFRPSDLEIGPDGALYFLDWQNPIIGHMQHNLRDPSRDRKHGRIYRVTHLDRPLLKSPAIAGEPIEKLLDLLKEPEDRVRHRVRIELGSRPTGEVIAALARWQDSLDKKDPEYEHHLLEALWAHQYQNVVDAQLLGRMLRSPDYRARAAATRVLCYWRDRVGDPLGLLKAQAEDEHPRVRLEAVRACSFFHGVRAVETALAVLKRPMDDYIRYTLRETMRQLESDWKPVVASGAAIAVDNPAGVDYLLESVTTAELVKLPRKPLVYQALLSRPQVAPEFRQEALAGLARTNTTTLLEEMLSAVERFDRTAGSQVEPALHDLGHLLLAHVQPQAGAGRDHSHDHGHISKASPEAIAAARPRLARLAAKAERPYVRQIAYVASMTADGTIETTWRNGLRDLTTLRDVLHAIPLIPSPELRGSAHDRIKELLKGLPSELAAQAAGARRPVGRFVRVELPRRGTLTLAEVQVFVDGVNIARAGTARQSSDGHGGAASKAIDGNTSGRYGDGGQTHTREDDDNPWWELDLGQEKPLEAVVIWNRSEANGQFVSRLDGFVITVLDARRQVIFKRGGNPAPLENVRIDLANDAAGAIRAAAIEAIVSTGKDQAATFAALATLIRSGDQMHTAVRAISRLPKASWPHAELQPLIDALIEHVRKLPASERTSESARNILQLGNDLAALLPARRAQAVRKTFRELGVPVIVIRPVPHLMIYDRPAIYVEAGKPVEIVFENADIMPHNLIIARPGSLEKVGIAAEKMAADPSAFERHFVPRLPDVLHSTKMLQPSQSERLQFTAPSTPGDYPYVCTFPGHWRRMYGLMHVVGSLDDVPAEALAATQAVTPVSTRPIVRVWKIEDLAGSLGQLEKGRDLARGKQLFTAVSCVQCHRMNGVGGQVGPDLADVRKKVADRKMTHLDVLTEMIEPSKVIDDKFRTNVIELVTGKVISGLIVHQTDKEIHVQQNPLEQKDDKPIVLATKQIAERTPSRVSLMPLGLLNTLDQEEILDLLAYVLSGGQ